MGQLTRRDKTERKKINISPCCKSGTWPHTGGGGGKGGRERKEGEGRWQSRDKGSGTSVLGSMSLSSKKRKVTAWDQTSTLWPTATRVSSQVSLPLRT